MAKTGVFADEVVGEEGEGDGGVEDGEGGEGDFDGAAGELFVFGAGGTGTDDAGGLDDEFAAETGGDGEDFFVFGGGRRAGGCLWGSRRVDEEDAAVVAVALYPAADGDGLVYRFSSMSLERWLRIVGPGFYHWGDGCGGRAFWILCSARATYSGIVRFRSRVGRRVRRRWRWCRCR